MPNEPSDPRAPRARRDRDRETPPRTTRSGTVALVGRPNVGKSTLLNALVRERLAITSAKPETTRDRILGVITRDDVQFAFVDTPGVHTARHELGARMNATARDVAEGADVLVLLGEADGDRPGPTPADRAVLEAFAGHPKALLALTKIDRVTPKAALFPVLEAWGAAAPGLDLVPVSAQKRDGLDALLRAVADRLPEGPFLFDPDTLTDRPVRFFVAEYLREQILRRARAEVPHGVAVEVVHFEEGEKLARIALTVHVTKDSHKGILVGKGGAMLKAIGTSARISAERLLGQKVHLDVRVRTTPGWFDVPARLDELGYGAAETAAPAKAKAKAKSRPKGPRPPKKTPPKASSATKPTKDPRP